MENTTKKLSKSKVLLIVLISVIGGLIVIGGSVLLLVFALVRTKVVSNLRVDNILFVATECRSGIVFGFSGIQLADAGGRRLRALVNPTDESIKVSLFQPQKSNGEDLGSCGKLAMHPQSSHVNGVQNQQGTATFSCTASGHTIISGTVNFRNCH